MVVNSSQPVPENCTPPSLFDLFTCMKGMSLQTGANVVLCASIDKVGYKDIHSEKDLLSVGLVYRFLRQKYTC